MKDKISIKDIINNMSPVTKANIQRIQNEFGSLDWKDSSGQSLLHLFVDKKYEEKKCLLAIKSLLIAGLNPNLVDDFRYNFIQTALYAGYSENFILQITTEAIKYGLDVNHIDSDLDTIMHTAIYSDDYTGELNELYKLLCSHGFDSTKICGEGRNLMDAIIFQNTYRTEQIKAFAEIFRIQTKNHTFSKDNAPIQDEQIKANTTQETGNTQSTSKHPPEKISKPIPENILKELRKFGRILTLKKYPVAPTIGREKELKNLLITLGEKKKSPIIVGESGIGKTALVEELAYRIQNNQVPTFLQGRVILDTNPTDVVAGCEYVGTFEKNMKKVMEICEEYDIIILFDEIHTIYGIGSTKNKDTDMADILRYYIDRTDIKVIGTTTEEEYQKYFSNKSLKRRFGRIPLSEPTGSILKEIINKVIEDYLLIEQMTFENETVKEQIINIIINATSKKHRTYNDSLNNPDLAISIIDKAFAVAKYYSSSTITPNHFAESFEYCDYIYETARNTAINSLRNLNNNLYVPKENKPKVLTLDFTKPQK